MPKTSFQGVTLPGGWEIDVPSITASGTRFRTLVQTYMTLGKSPLAAEDAAQKACVNFWTKEWKARVMKTVGRKANVYAGRNFGSLSGFDPEPFAELWLPGELFLANPADARLFIEMRRRGDE